MSMIENEYDDGKVKNVRILVRESGELKIMLRHSTAPAA